MKINCALNSFLTLTISLKQLLVKILETRTWYCKIVPYPLVLNCRLGINQFILIKKGIIIVVLTVKRTILNYVKRIKYIVVSVFLRNILLHNG